MEHSSNRPEDFPLNVFSVTPYTPSTADIQVSDDDKAGATLLFSGIFLGLVGITFTVMGWIKYQGVSHFEWTQLLGPILLSVGVTFVLIAVCKFKMLSCQLCTESEERVLDSDPTSGGQSFVFTGINQPITFHGATVVQYIPPPYGSQEPLGMNAAFLQPMINACGLVPASGAAATIPSPPQYYTIYPQDNAAFVENEGYPPFVGVGNDRYAGSRDLCSFVQRHNEYRWLGLDLQAGDGDRKCRCRLPPRVGATDLRKCNCVLCCFRPSSDPDQLEGTQMEEEDCVRFSPPPYEEIYALPR